MRIPMTAQPQPGTLLGCNVGPSCLGVGKMSTSMSDGQEGPARTKSSSTGSTISASGAISASTFLISESVSNNLNVSLRASSSSAERCVSKFCYSERPLTEFSHYCLRRPLDSKRRSSNWTSSGTCMWLVTSICYTLQLGHSLSCPGLGPTMQFFRLGLLARLFRFFVNL